MSFGFAFVVVLSLLACVVQSRNEYLLVERFNNSDSCDHKYFVDATAFVVNICINYQGNYMQFVVSNDNVVSEYSCTDSTCNTCTFEETIPNSCGNKRATTLIYGLPSYTPGLNVASYYEIEGCYRPHYVELSPSECYNDTTCYSYNGHYLGYSCGFPWYDGPSNNTANSTTTGKVNSTSSSSTGSGNTGSTTRSSSNSTTTGSNPSPPTTNTFAWLSSASYYSSSCSSSGMVSASYIPSNKCIPGSSGYGYFTVNSGIPTLYSCTDAACKSCTKSQNNVTLDKCASAVGGYGKLSLHSTFPAYNNTRVEVEVYYQGTTCPKDVNSVIQVEVYQRGCSQVNATCVASTKASASKSGFCNPPAFLFNTPTSGSTSSAPVTYTTVISTTLFMSGNSTGVKLPGIISAFAASLGVAESSVKARIVPKVTRNVQANEYDFSIVLDVQFTTSNNQNEIDALKSVVETAVQSSSVNTVLGDQGVYVTSYSTTSTTTANPTSTGGSSSQATSAKTSSASWLLPSVSFIFATLSMILLC